MPPADALNVPESGTGPAFKESLKVPTTDLPFQRSNSLFSGANKYSAAKQGVSAESNSEVAQEQSHLYTKCNYFIEGQRPQHHRLNDLSETGLDLTALIDTRQVVG